MRVSVFCLTGLLLLLSSCTQDLAPVVELSRRNNQLPQKHIVSSKETLYSIAFRYDKDYRMLAKLNHLQSPYLLHVGQILLIYPMHAPIVIQKKTVSSTYYKPPQLTKSVYSGIWVWPVHGKIVTSFRPQQGSKGIDILGKPKQAIHAANAGVVAYAGHGLSGYGNLIIIKHANGFLTAYGNNALNLVKEGQKIQAGQTIAQMGMMSRKHWGIHFEIRKNGQPVNPLYYLR